VLLGGLPGAWTLQKEGPGTWSPREVVGHLIEGERSDWIPRARIVLAQGPSLAFQPFDRFAHQRSMSARVPLEELFETFTGLRTDNLAHAPWLVADAGAAGSNRNTRGVRLGDAEAASVDMGSA
jgi:hypothetical protein